MSWFVIDKVILVKVVWTPPGPARSSLWCQARSNCFQAIFSLSPGFPGKLWSWLLLHGMDDHRFPGRHPCWQGKQCCNLFQQVIIRHAIKPAIEGRCLRFVLSKCNQRVVFCVVPGVLWLFLVKAPGPLLVNDIQFYVPSRP